MRISSECFLIRVPHVLGSQGVSMSALRFARDMQWNCGNQDTSLF